MEQLMKLKTLVIKQLVQLMEQLIQFLILVIHLNRFLHGII